jgi:hypothetical protein
MIWNKNKKSLIIKMAYASLYQNNTFSILDNRKFFKPNASIYELPPRNNLYIPDETLAEKINYSYCKPPSLIPKEEVYNYQYNDMVLGNRDIANKEVVSKDGVKEKEEEQKENYENQTHSCSFDPDGVKNVCGAGKKLFPIMDARFNLRECAKNMILLEDHLFHSGKQCEDCIKKHCLTIEALLEEGVTLDLKGDHSVILIETFNNFRDIFVDLCNKMKSQNLKHEDCVKAAQNIRKIRKPLCQEYATFV